MLSAYYSFPAQTPENELVDERWDNDFESSIYSVTDNKHINDKRNYITPTTLKEINLPHSNNMMKAPITPDNKDIDDDIYFEITSAPPDYPSTPSVTEDEEEEDDLSTPSLNEALPLEKHNNYYESLEEEGEEPDQYFPPENVYDYHSELSNYYKQLVLNQFDQLPLSRLELIRDTLPEMYKQQIERLSNL